MGGGGVRGVLALLPVVVENAAMGEGTGAFVGRFGVG